MTADSEHIARILLVEDNPGDAALIVHQAARHRLTNPIDHVPGGQEAIDYLAWHLDQGSLPDLVLLDLNMPGVPGQDVLQWIRGHEDETLRQVPVIVLTSSSADEDVIETYDLGASAYVVKPVGLEGFEAIVRALDGFWFSIVRLPPR